MPDWVEAALVIAGCIAGWVALIAFAAAICGANGACEKREMRPAGRAADRALTLGSASQPRIPDRITNWNEDWNRRRQIELYDATAPGTTTNGRDRGQAA